MPRWYGNCSVGYAFQLWAFFEDWMGFMGIRLMIADDHVAVRAGIVGLIQGTEIELVCQAETCEQTVKFANTCQPDVLLLDVRLTGSDGMAALEQLKHKSPKVAVLMFSATDEVKEMAHSRKLGAKGFLQKSATRDEILNAIRRVAAGKSVWTPRQLRQVVSRAAAEALAKKDRNPLSPREAQVLKKITAGLSNEGIAEALDIDIETVKQHVKHVLRKLHVEDRTQAAVLALRTDMAD
jgi:DNA-binding NarL/FixJ family response regulator